MLLVVRRHRSHGATKSFAEREAAMDLRYVSAGLHLDRTEASISSRFSSGSFPLFLVDTGSNSAGNGGKGYFVGSLADNSFTSFDPSNMAEAGPHATADARQTNIAYFGQAATQIAGVGGDGGDGNVAQGGSVVIHGAIGSDVITTGANSAGNGGDGYSSGALIHAPVAVYDPINIAVAGSHSTAVAHQSNVVQFNQGATQIAGVGGQGGDGNAAIGGDVSVFGGHASGSGLISSEVIASGANHVGNGGDGHFFGSLVHTSFALYDPINIAVAGYNSNAHADQLNNVDFNQGAFQMAGVGGQGGNGNTGSGGSMGVFSADQGLIGSDVIATGANSAGNGGDGHFSGSLIDVNVAIYAPINIAIAGYNSTADAHQSNNVHFDQSAIQIAGVGGDGGHANLALGGDLASHLLADPHLLDHLG
jgi:hypothetical protein